MPNGKWYTSPDRRVHDLAWSHGKNRNRARLRREMPSRLVSRLRAVAAKLRLTVVEYEHETGPSLRPFWVDVWIKLPDGREAGIDTIWDSGLPLPPADQERQAEKEKWLAEREIPYLFLRRKRSSIEMEADLYRWLRKVKGPDPAP